MKFTYQENFSVQSIIWQKRIWIGTWGCNVDSVDSKDSSRRENYRPDWSLNGLEQIRGLISTSEIFTDNPAHITIRDTFRDAIQSVLDQIFLALIKL